MKTIVKIEIADCDGGGIAFVVCEDYNINELWAQFETETEAVGYIKEANDE